MTSGLVDLNLACLPKDFINYCNLFSKLCHIHQKLYSRYHLEFWHGIRRAGELLNKEELLAALQQKVNEEVIFWNKVDTNH